MTKYVEQLWHALEKEAVFQKLNSSDKGLSEAEAKNRLKIFGHNIISSKSFGTILRIFVRQFRNPIVYMLFFSTLLALILRKLTDSCVILSVLILNAMISFFQEYRAHKIIKALTSMVPSKTSVLRNGKRKLIHSSSLVPGDVVLLQAGDRIAADLRLFSVKNLECNESALTGESLPVLKNEQQVKDDSSLADRTCMAFNGTYVTSGTGFGLVVATGFKSEFGKISELVEHIENLETPMALNIKKIVQWISWGILGVSGSLFVVGYLRGSSLFDAAIAAIALAVAAIPEGLPAIITIASSIGVRRMACKHAIIRQLPAVEALGCATVICTDKTGTLTYNELMVQQIRTRSGAYVVSGAGYSLEGQIQLSNGNDNEELEEILTAAILCSNAKIEQGENGLISDGDPTEIALIVVGRKKGLMEEKIRKDWLRQDVIPFESEKRYMASLNQSPKHQNFIFVKGAPEEIAAMCDHSSHHEEILGQAHLMAQEGMRVIAIAKKEFKESISKIKEKDIKGGYALLGFIGMLDPPRKEVYQALKACREAGINVKMVTGDHPLTAQAVAQDLGILDSGNVVISKELESLDRQGWKEVARLTQVFARVTPQHKLRLVEVLQELGHVVVMTGDGLNDAAALKRADIGVAMGVRGTAIAKEAADVILADDDFTSIEEAIKEGRRVYDNLIKSLTFILPTSLGQSLVIFLAILFFPVTQKLAFYPMSPLQILWVNLVVAIALSLPLAFEPEESDVMKRPPEKKSKPILSKFLLAKTAGVSAMMAIGAIALFLWEYYREIEHGISEGRAFAEAQTIAVTGLIWFQSFYLFHCRYLNRSKMKVKFFSNRYIFMGIASVFIAQIFFIYLPFMNKIFKTVALDFESVFVSFLVVFLMIPVLIMDKFIKKY